MNWAYLHLILNHFPIIGVLIGTCILTAGMFSKNQGATLSGLATIAFAALTAMLAYLTGDPASTEVKAIPGIMPDLVSRHENIATVAMYLMVPAGLLATVTFYSIIKKDRSVLFLVIITLAMSVISSAGMVYTGLTGGLIRHSELRDTAQKKYTIEYQNDTIDEDN